MKTRYDRDPALGVVLLALQIGYAAIWSDKTSAVDKTSAFGIRPGDHSLDIYCENRAREWWDKSLWVAA